MLIRLLGPLEVIDEADGARPLGGPKQRAVLAVLAIHLREVVSIDRLVDAIWGEEPPAAATATLQAYISNLRRILQPDAEDRASAPHIVNRSGGYLLDLDADCVDARLFEKLLEESRRVRPRDPGSARDLLAEALSLWHGPALADFTYARFASSEISRLEELRTIALEERIEADLAAGRHREMVAELEQLVSEHPLRERLWQLLATALANSGRHPEALRALRRHQAHLAEELGLSPSPSMRDLEDAILLGTGPTAPGAPAVTTSPSESQGDESDLFGRRPQLDRFAVALTEARSGRGTVILLEGEPGIGKTRLMEAMQHQAEGKGFPTAMARCVEVGGSPPFWPWIQLSRGLMEALGVAEVTEASGPYGVVLAPFFPELRPGGGGHPIRPQIAPHVVAEGILHAMRTLTRAHPLVMFIDDLYSADPDSLSVLALLAAEVGSLGLVIVGSYRSTGLPHDHPLATTLAELSRIGRVERLRLPGLDRQELTALVAAQGHEPHPELVDALHERTDGNAFFAVELLRLVGPDADVTLVGDSDTVPGSVRDVLRRRVAQLGDESVHLLRTAAVCGRRWDLEVVREVTGQDLDTALDALDEAVDAGLVVEEPQAGRYRFAHVLVADALAQELGGMRRCVIHQRVSDVLGRRHPGDAETLIAVAHHATAAVPAAGVGPALEALRAAGHHSLTSSALALGEQLFQRRLDLVASMPSGPDRDRAEISALLDLALVWTWREGYQSAKADEAARRVLSLLGREPEDEQALADMLAAYQARISHAIVGGSPDDTLPLVRELDDLAARHPKPEARFSAAMNGLVWAVHAGQVAEAVARSEAAAELLKILEPDGSGRRLLPLNMQSMLVTHRAFSSWAHWLAGDLHATRAALSEARRVAGDLGHTFTRGFLCAVENLVAHMSGSPEWVADVVTWARFDPTLAEFGLQPLWMLAGEAWSQGMAGEPEAGLPQLRRVLDGLEEIGAGVTRTQYLGMAAELELEASRLEDAMATLDEAISLADSRGELYWKPELLRLRASAFRLLGNDDRADADLTEAAELARRLGILPLLERITADRPALL